MKNKLNELFILAILVLTAFTSCGGDESNPKEQLIVKGQTFDLSDANLYLTYEGNWNSEANNARTEGVTYSHFYRDFVITDGVFENNYNGAYWNSSNFTGASYIVVVELAIPIGKPFKGGSFPQNQTWKGISSDAKVSWFQVELLGDNYEFLETHNSAVVGDPVVVSGSWDDTGTMTIKINAKDMYDYENDVEDVSVKLFFKGTVQADLYNSPS